MSETLNGNSMKKFMKNHYLSMIIIFSFSFSIVMFFVGQEVKEREFYEERQFFREAWDCETIEAMIFPTGTWNSFDGNSQREYLNSLWIVKECWKR